MPEPLPPRPSATVLLVRDGATTSHWQDATIRQLEIIGEATKNLSPELRANHPQIPWRRIACLRDVLIHHYMGVDLEAVWEITQRNLPELKNQVQHLLNQDLRS